jgi:hypothetical protein
MSAHYTPLDLVKFLKDTPLSENSLFIKREKKPLFDRVFLPFSLAIFLCSLTFWGIKYTISKAQDTTHSDTPAAQIVSALKPTLVPTKVEEKVYAKIGDIAIDTEKLSSSAKAQYPNFTKEQLVTTVNKSLIEWAALRQYFKQDPLIMKKLKVDITKPIENFATINTDLGILIVAYDKKDDLGKPPTSQLTEEFQKHVEIR